MKIAMMGAGGVGGFFGGRLAKAGYDVTFIARGKHLAAMQSQGLLIESQSHGDIHINDVNATDDPESLGKMDLIVVSVKLWDNPAVLKTIKPMIGKNTTVLSLQNGVLKEDFWRNAFGDAALIGGVAYVGSHIERPGVIQQAGAMQRIVIGEYDGRASARVQFLLKAFQRSGVTCEVSSDVLRAIWEKYVFLVGMSGATASMRAALGPIRTHPKSRAFFLELMREAVAVGQACGVQLPQTCAESWLKFGDNLPAHIIASMYHDLQGGRPLEVDWLSGGVVKLGVERGVPTPANSAVCNVLALHANGTSAFP